MQENKFMSFKTQVIWNIDQLDQLDPLAVQQIDDYKVELHNQGRRVGPVDVRIDIDGPEAGQKTVIHEWVDEATAQDWIAFISQLGPVSATILS